ncbi:hypothetical protein [Magnetospirillum sp. UT-4]|uniref:hypothetical protein n=1 Tax=Magnetospirillum sp. UT-4 TaxID=2681467 RepID=UPI001380D5BA|nr:hypothetical protein [Magnetospirillum sp. UT-4]CAA7625333.1 conserved exported hypothetical protein [Magnetospirillum sp. UT-4]
MTGRPVAFAAVLACLAMAPHAWAAGGGGEKKELPHLGPTKAVVLKALKGTTDAVGLKINVTQVNFPGVPERAACRMTVRVSNPGSRPMATHLLLKTFDTYKAAANTWLIPTGEVAPGATVERLYSCKMAQFLVFDQDSASAWPNRCTVEGEESSPCPVGLLFETNLNLTEAAAIDGGGGAKGGGH